MIATFGLAKPLAHSGTVSCPSLRPGMNPYELLDFGEGVRFAAVVSHRDRGSAHNGHRIRGEIPSGIRRTGRLLRERIGQRAAEVRPQRYVECGRIAIIDCHNLLPGHDLCGCLPMRRWDRCCSEIRMIFLCIDGPTRLRPAVSPNVHSAVLAFRRTVTKIMHAGRVSPYEIVQLRFKSRVPGPQ